MRVSVVGNGHVRAIACGDDGKSFKLIAFRAADIHGADLNGDGSSQDSLFQATLPVACGEIVNTKR